MWILYYSYPIILYLCHYTIFLYIYFILFYILYFLFIVLFFCKWSFSVNNKNNNSNNIGIPNFLQTFNHIGFAVLSYFAGHKSQLFPVKGPFQLWRLKTYLRNCLNTLNVLTVINIKYPLVKISPNVKSHRIRSM